MKTLVQRTRILVLASHSDALIKMMCTGLSHTTSRMAFVAVGFPYGAKAHHFVFITVMRKVQVSIASLCCQHGSRTTMNPFASVLSATKLPVRSNGVHRKLK